MTAAATRNEPEQIAIDRLRIDGGTQPRERLDAKLIAEIVEALRDGEPVPPVVAFFDGSAHWLADGFHRLDAHKKSGKLVIASDVRSGSKRDALMFAIGANASADKARWTSADKRRAVSLILADAASAGMSTREIATLCKCHHATVARLKEELSLCDSPQPSAQPPRITDNRSALQAEDADEAPPKPPESKPRQKKEPTKPAPPEKPKRKASKPGRIQLEAKEFDAKVVELADAGHPQAEIARILDVEASRISTSFKRQKMGSFENPLSKLLGEAQEQSDFWSTAASNFQDKWAAGSPPQRKALVDEIRKMVDGANAFIRALNKR